MLANHLSFKPKLPNMFTGKVTKELNKRQSYNKLYKKPYHLQKHLPSANNTQTVLNKLTNLKKGGELV